MTKAGGDRIHCDVMDGHFVDNISLRPGLREAARGYVRPALDIHLTIMTAGSFFPGSLHEVCPLHFVRVAADR